MNVTASSVLCAPECMTAKSICGDEKPSACSSIRIFCALQPATIAITMAMK